MRYGQVSSGHQYVDQSGILHLQEKAAKPPMQSFLFSPVLHLPAKLREFMGKLQGPGAETSKLFYKRPESK